MKNKKELQKGESEIGCSIGIIWFIAVIYAFMKWGVLHGIINIFIPYALPWDVAKFLVNKL